MNESIRKIRAWSVSLLAAAVCGVVNPAVIGCSDAESDERDWGYTAEDMEAAVVGEYVGQVDGENVSIRVSRPKAAGAAAPHSNVLRNRSLQCGGRSFVRPAGACISTTSMDLDAEVTSDSGLLTSGKLEGRFTAFGGVPLYGQVEFSSGSTLSIVAEVDDGAITRWYLRTSGTATDLPLSRVP
jgi:hypothetical protein